MNYEICQKEASKYKTQHSFSKKSYNYYSFSKKNGWIELFYPNDKVKWTKEAIKQEALKYKTRSDFRSGNLSAYTHSTLSPYHAENCLHMTRRTGTLEKRFVYVVEFEDGSVYVGLTFSIDERIKSHLLNDKSAVYQHIILNPNIKYEVKSISEKGFLVDEAIRLEKKLIMEYKKQNIIILNKSNGGEVGGNKKFTWTYEEAKEIAKMFKNRNDFYLHKTSCYESCKKNDWLDEFMPLKYNKNWTKEEVKEKIIIYKNRKELIEKGRKYYEICKKNGWLDELSPLESKETKWTYEKCKYEASKYKKRNDLAINSSTCYAHCRKNGWLNEFFLNKYGRWGKIKTGI